MFEHSLIDLEERKQRRRLSPLPIAIGLHLVVLGSFAAAQLWSVEEVGEPPIQVIYFGDPPPPPPPPAGSRRPTQATTQRPATPQTPVQPDADRIPETPAPAPADTEDVLAEGDPFGSPDGVAGGVYLGVPGGVLDSQGIGGIGGNVGSPAPPEPRERIVRYNGTMTRPVQLSGRQPRYSELARRAAIQGTVILEAVIDKEGRVSNVRILKGLPMGLDTEAVAAVQDWIFEPAKLDGRPVSVYYTLTVNFQIQR